MLATGTRLPSSTTKTRHGIEPHSTLSTASRIVFSALCAATRTATLRGTPTSTCTFAWREYRPDGLNNCLLQSQIHHALSTNHAALRDSRVAASAHSSDRRTTYGIVNCTLLDQR